MGRLTEEVFNESCCEGPTGECVTDSQELAARHAAEHAESINVPSVKMGTREWLKRMRGEESISTSVVAPTAEEFVIKDSGKRMEFDSGMVRDTIEGKTDYSLIMDGPMLERWAIHLTKGAQKYSARNWMKAEGEAELERFRQSAIRHFFQWMRGERDEDHAAAVYFNVNGVEYTREKLDKP